MSMTYECPAVDDQDTVHRYVAGTLEPDELETFEAHLLECAVCERAVREGIAIRQALMVGPSSSSGHGPFRWAVPLALAAAAAVIWLWLPSDDAIRRLGRVDPVPTLDALPVRAEPDSAMVLADRGLAAYMAGDYERGEDLLGEAARLTPGPALHFFLGIALLKTGSPREAAVALERALSPPDNAYAAEARLYLAKAWLARGQADSALAHLSAIPRSAASVHAHAAALADSVREALR